MNRLFGLFLMFWLTLAPAPAATAETAATVALKPTVLRALQRAGAAPRPTARGTTRSPLDADGVVLFPAAIAFDANGCFAGYFPYPDLKQLKFECLGASDQLALARVHPQAAKQGRVRWSC